MLADSDESVESDEDFYFVDDNKNQSPYKKKSSSDLPKPAPRRLKAVMKGPEQVSLNSATTELQSSDNSIVESSSNPEEVRITKADDFAKMMATFDGFNQDSSQEDKEKDEQSVRSYRNKLFLATREGTERNSDSVDVPMLVENGTSGKPALSDIGDGEVQSDVPTDSGKHTGESKDDRVGSLSTLDSCASDSSDLLSEINQQKTDENTENEEHKIYVNLPIATSNNHDVVKKSIKDKDEQIVDDNILEEEKKSLTTTGQKENQSLTTTSQKENQSLTTTSQKENQSLTTTSQKENQSLTTTSQKENQSLTTTSQKENQSLTTTSQKENQSLTTTSQKENQSLTTTSQKENQSLTTTSQKENQSIPTQTEPQLSSLNETENAKTSSEARQQLNSDKETNSNQDYQNSSSVSKSSERSQETYITVLPTTLEKSDGNDGKKSDQVTMVDDLENDTDSRFDKAGKTRGKCLSYLVVSGGEGHVDLRLRVKSKQDLKKDAQSMFLIWRVNSKI